MWAGPSDCDIWAQDCPAGEKCAPHTVPDGWYGETWCVPIVDDPHEVGEACVVIEGDHTGRDDCVAGAFCWDHDVGGGVCLAVCAGTSTAPECDDPRVCAIFVADVLPLCLDRCHPLAQDCPADQRCVSSLYELSFMCVPVIPRVDGGLHAPCAASNGCDPGLHCSYWENAAECDEQSGRCCEALCDLSAPNSCPGLGQVCEPWYPGDLAPAELKDLGACAVPK